MDSAIEDAARRTQDVYVDGVLTHLVITITHDKKFMDRSVLMRSECVRMRVKSKLKSSDDIKPFAEDEVEAWLLVGTCAEAY